MARPGDAVTISGWKELPEVGDEVLGAREADIKRALENRRRKVHEQSTLSDAEAINELRGAQGSKAIEARRERRGQNMML